MNCFAELRLVVAIDVLRAQGEEDGLRPMPVRSCSGLGTSARLHRPHPIIAQRDHCPIRFNA